MDGFMDDVANCLERSDSSVMGLAGVQDVTVVSFDPFHTTKDLKDGLAGVDAVVEVRYDYARGSL
jgi:hypothetical protein